MTSEGSPTEKSEPLSSLENDAMSVLVYRLCTLFEQALVAVPVGTDPGLYWLL